MAKTAKSASDTPTPPADTAAPSATLRYVGPPGQTSPVFGALEPNRTYPADATFAAYLATKHPEYWQLEPAKE